MLLLNRLEMIDPSFKCEELYLIYKIFFKNGSKFLDM